MSNGGNINEFRNDHDLRIFLTFDGELEVRGKNAKEKITSWFNKGQQAFDNIISDKQTDPDDFYESKKLWLNEYHTRFVNIDARQVSAICSFVYHIQYIQYMPLTNILLPNLIGIGNSYLCNCLL